MVSSSASAAMMRKQLTTVILELQSSVAEIQSYLVALQSQQQQPVSQVFLHGMPGYETTTFSFQGVHPSTSVPIQQPWMLPPPSISHYALASMMGLVHTMASTFAAMMTVALAPSTGTIVLPGVPTIQHPFTDGIFYRDASFQQV